MLSPATRPRAGAMLAGCRRWMQLPAAVPAAVWILRQARIFLIKPASLDAISFLQWAELRRPLGASPAPRPLQPRPSPVVPRVRFSHPAQAVVALLVLTSLAVPAERVVTSPGGMVSRWYRCSGIRCAFGSINSSKENPRASPVPSGLCHRAGLTHLHPIAAGIAQLPPASWVLHPGGFRGLFFPSLHPQDGDGCSWYPKDAAVSLVVPSPTSEGTRWLWVPPGLSSGTFGLRLRPPKGVMEVSIPFAKAGGRGRAIVWCGGDPSGAALC